MTLTPNANGERQISDIIIIQTLKPIYTPPGAQYSTTILVKSFRKKR